MNYRCFIFRSLFVFLLIHGVGCERFLGNKASQKSASEKTNTEPVLDVKYFGTWYLTTSSCKYGKVVEIDEHGIKTVSKISQKYRVKSADTGEGSLIEVQIPDDATMKYYLLNKVNNNLRLTGFATEQITNETKITCDFSLTKPITVQNPVTKKKVNNKTAKPKANQQTKLNAKTSKSKATTPPKKQVRPQQKKKT